MKKYKVYDLYEYSKETIGYADTLSEVKKITRERYDDTDGECFVVYAPLNPETQKYSFSKNKVVTL